MVIDDDFEKCIKFIKVGCFLSSSKNFLKLPTGKIIFIVLFSQQEL